MPVLPPAIEVESTAGDASGGSKAGAPSDTNTALDVAAPAAAEPADSAAPALSDNAPNSVADSGPAAPSAPTSPDLHHNDAHESASESRAVIPANAGITVPPAALASNASSPLSADANAKPAAGSDVHLPHGDTDDDDEEDDGGSLSGQDPIDSKSLAALEKAKPTEPPAAKDALVSKPDAAVTVAPDSKPEPASALQSKPDATPAPEPHVDVGAPAVNGVGQGLEDGPPPLPDPSGSKPTPPTKAKPRPPADKFYMNEDYPPLPDRLSNGHTNDLEIPYRSLGFIVLVFLAIFLGVRWRRRPRYGSPPQPILVVQDELPVAHKPRQYRD